MPGGRTKFQENWLENSDANGDTISNWCTKGKSEFHAYCTFCKCDFSIANGGLSQLSQHAGRVKHLNASKQLKGQMTLDFKSSNGKNAENIANKSKISLSLSVKFNTDQLSTRAEALWAMKVATSDYSFGSCNDIVPLFKSMFENNAILNGMKLSDRKLSYILSHGLGPYFHSEIISDLKDAIRSESYYTLGFDETTTAQVKKQLDIYVRFWSPKFDQVFSAYVTSLFLGHATADLIYEGISSVLRTNDIPISKMLMISMDGPNVNISVARKINEELKSLEQPELVNIGTCSLHKVHNCFSKALETLPFDIEEFSTDLFSFFKYSAARREDLKEMEKLLECEEKFLLRHVDSRWLTLIPVINRILLIYPALTEYFLNFLPKQANLNLQNNSRYKRIVSALKDPIAVVYLEFVASVSHVLMSYLNLFQSEGPLVHMLHSKMNMLLYSIMTKFMNLESANSEGTKLINIDIEDFNQYRPLNNIDVGTGAKKALSKVSEKKSKEARMAIRAFLVKLCQNLKQTLPLCNNFLKNLEKLHPSMRSNASENAVRFLCATLPLKMSNEGMDKIITEWQLYVTDPEVDELCKKIPQTSDKVQRIDVFWKDVLKMTDTLDGQLKYKNLAVLVKNCLSLSHGNSDLERGFSLNNNIVTKSRSNLSENTIIALRQVKDTVRRYGDILSVPITAKMLNFVTKSHSAYTHAIELERKVQEEERRKRMRDEEEIKLASEAKKLKEDKEEKLQKLNIRIKTLEDDLSSAQSCLAEGNKRLQNALGSKRNMAEIKIASLIIESATKKISSLSEELKKEKEKQIKLLTDM